LQQALLALAVLSMAAVTIMIIHLLTLALPLPTVYCASKRYRVWRAARTAATACSTCAGLPAAPTWRAARCSCASRPNAALAVSQANGKVRIGTGQQATELDRATAAHVFVTTAD
jgi:hypothetical protein